MWRLLIVIAVCVPSGAAWAAKPKAAPVAPRVPVVVAVTPVADTTTGRFASEEGLRRYLSARLLEQGGQLTEALGEYYRALAFDPRSADLLVRISQLCAQLGDPARSLEFAERALANDPDDWRALWLQGAARFSTGRVAEALAPLERACDIDSTQVEVLRTTARVAERLRRSDVVERAWRRLSYVDPDDGEAWFQIAAVLGRRGEFTAAETALERALDLNPTRPGMLFLLGWVKENLGKTAAAIELYQRHLEVHRDDVGTRRRLVDLLLRADRVRESYDEARRAQLAEPENPEGLQVIADLALRLKRTSEADAALAKLRAKDPGDPENTARAVVVLARNGRGREAAKLADDWLQQHPGHPAGLVLAVRAWSAAGVPDSAIARARAAVAVTPDSIDSHRLLARTLQDAGRYAEAEKEWLTVRDLRPGEPGTWLDLGGCRERAGDIDGAVAAGRQALKLAPGWAPALNFIGYVMADHDRDLAEARKFIERALELEPDNGAFLDSHGWVLHRQGHHAEARKLLERAILLTNGDPVVREHLGDVYRALDLRDLAREQYRLGAALNGENAGRVSEKLRALR